jgi:prepilin-type N-terminal cleavage/methylation domain-containing protein
MKGGRRRRAVLKNVHEGADSLAVHRVHSHRRPDRGLTFVEILITIAIMSIVIVSVMVALRVSTLASRVDKDHANIYAWLQDATDRVQQTPRMTCTAPGPLLTKYNEVAKGAPRPSGWPVSTTIAVTQVQFLGPVENAEGPVAGEYTWGAGCFEHQKLFTQKVTITATGPDGMTKTLEMVKGAN